ncbi:MAG: tetratricopeptide repeat protein [Nitrospinae bacterium]|nr:tetratricopeptide repeat protein [Nitrospinota bacterium]
MVSDNLDAKHPPLPHAMVIADDDGQDGVLIKRSVKELGYNNVHVFTSAKEALDLLASGVGVIFIVNHNNKTLNGLDAIRHVKGTSAISHLPALLSSYDRTTAGILAAKNANADGYIIKPITPMNVLRAIKTASERRTESLMAIMRQSEREITSAKDSIATSQAAKREIYASVIKSLYVEISSFPNRSRNYLELGKLLVLSGQKAHAGDHFQKAIETREPNDDEPYIQMAEYHASVDNYEKAAGFAKMALTVKFSIKTLVRLGELQSRAGDLNGSIVTFKSVVDYFEKQKQNSETDKMLAKCYNERGKVYLEKGEQDDNPTLIKAANADFKHSAEKTPNFMAAQYNLMITYKKMGDTQAAMKVADKIKSIEPEDFEGWIMLAESYHRDGYAPGCALALDKAVHIDLNNLENHKQVAHLYIEYDFIEKAERLLASTVSSVPGDSSLLNMLGIVYRRMGKRDMAIEQYRKALEFDNEDAGIHFNLGRALLDAGKIEEAKTMFRKCVSLDPNMEEAKKYV